MAVGLSEAIGAIMFGLLMSETRHKARVHELFLPFQQFFCRPIFCRLWHAY